MNLYRILVTFTLFLVFGYSYAQTGTVRGTVTDQETGEPLPFANVIIVGTTTGTSTDFDGQFTLTLAPGTYKLQFSLVSFKTLTVESVIVKANEVNNLSNVALPSSMTELKEVVISAEMARDNENALQAMKMNSATVLDGISSGSFKKIGDTDASASIARVPGVTVQGGKYVFVRGLGDRYAKTMLNGMDIPGLDPDRNTLQMDIFPTSVLDNILVYKSFTADLPADFTGGIVDINTKSFQEEKGGNISIGAGYNPSFHFNSNYLTSKTSSTDFLGFDDGLRAIPLEGSNIPQFANAIGNPESPTGVQYQDNLASFNPNMGAFRENSLMDFNLGFDFGNQYQRNDKTYSYNLVFSYRNSTEYYSDVQYARYGLDSDPNNFEQTFREKSVGELGRNVVLMSGMAGFSMKTKKSKYILNLLYLQSGESQAGIFDYKNADQGAVFEGYQHNIEYSQRSLANVYLAGEHYFENPQWEVNWKLSPTLSTMEDPDIRFTRYEVRNNATDLVIGTEAGLPERIWRDLREINIPVLVKFTKEYTLLGSKSKLFFGGNYTYKTRDFDIRNFIFEAKGQNATTDPFKLKGNPDELFYAENLWPRNGNTNSGTIYNVPWLAPDGSIRNPNYYSSNVNNVAGFVSTEINPFPKIKVIAGLRMENYTQKYTGSNQLGTIALYDSTVLAENKFFPTLNVVYAVNKKQNLRFSVAKTIARPSFKELSYAEIYDPLTSRTFIGGLFQDFDPSSGELIWDGKLVSTEIYNGDVRWEFLPKSGANFTIGAFYKYFVNPIEVVQFAQQAGAFQPRNVGNGQLVGIEFEFRHGLEFISEKLQKFTTSMNLTFTQSRIDYSITEKESREANKRTGQVIGDYREMAGQSPYVVNAGIAYSGGKDGKGFLSNFDLGLYYNVQGPTLLYVGIVDRPDVYSEPFHSLRFNSTKRFGKNDRMSLGFKVDNILGDIKEEYSVSYNSEDQIFTSVNPGTRYSLTFGFKF